MKATQIGEWMREQGEDLLLDLFADGIKLPMVILLMVITSGAVLSVIQDDLRTYYKLPPKLVISKGETP